MTPPRKLDVDALVAAMPESEVRAALRDMLHATGDLMTAVNPDAPIPRAGRSAVDLAIATLALKDREIEHHKREINRLAGVAFGLTASHVDLRLQLERMQPLRSVLGDWDWGVIAKEIEDGDVLDELCGKEVARAFAFVETAEEQARKAVEEVVRQLKKGKIPIKNEAVVEIQNIVASASLGGKVHLEEAARVLPKSMYEPEQFPGLIHRMADPKTVILLFASGKLVCTGAKKESEVYRAVNNLHVTLEEKGLMVY